MRQFFFKHKYKHPEKDEIVEADVSFNIDKVVTTFTSPDGSMVVNMDDWHEEWQEVEQKNKAGKVTGVGKAKNTVRSVITLNPEDTKRFKETTDVNWTDEIPFSDPVEHKEKIEEFIKENVDNG